MNFAIDLFCCELKRGIKGSAYYTEDRIEFKQHQQYKSVRMCQVAVLRIVEQKSGTKLEMAKRFLKFAGIKDEAEIKESDPLWARIPFTESIVDRILENAKTVFEECYKEGAVEIFGCCSRYRECSDQKKCIHPDIKEAQGCMYKFSLEKGQIFYGKNCNVDVAITGPDIQGKQDQPG